MLKPCHECGHEFAPNERKCPKCLTTRPVTVGQAIVAVILCCVVFYVFSTVAKMSYRYAGELVDAILG